MRVRTTHKKARVTWIIRPRPDGIYIDKGGIEKGPMREGEALTAVAKYLTSTVAPIVLGPNASIGRLSEAEHTYTDEGQHTAPFIVYDRRGRELDRGWNLPGLFRKHRNSFMREASMTHRTRTTHTQDEMPLASEPTPRTLKAWDEWEPEPGVTKVAGREVRGPHLSVRFDRGFSAATHALDPHGQVYQGLILMDKGGKRPYRAALEFARKNVDMLSKMRTTYEIREAVDAAVMEATGKRAQWHSYHMPD